MRVMVAAALLAYLPGLILFRLPVANRDKRAGLPAEERVFWYVIISLAATSCVALSLAVARSYSWDALRWANAGVCVLLATSSRGRLKLGAAARRPHLTALVPVALATLAAAMVFQVPPAEYVMGGKDPGTYMNEGIQIAQRGSLEIRDPVVASVPPAFRDLFFPDRNQTSYYSNRFMGFFLIDPDEGTVVGQFAHLYPIWIAIGYGADGLSGARYMVGLWAVLGVLAVYFAAAWLVGRAAAAAGAALLAVHVTQVWYGRYPNAEILMQGLLFGSLLAFSRASVDEDRFFAPLAATLVSLSLFTHFTAVLAVAALAGASLLGIFVHRRPQMSFLIPVTLGSAAALTYYATLLRPYFDQPIRFLRYLSPTQLALIGLGLTAGAAVLWTATRPSLARRVRRWLPWSVVALMWGLALYSYFFRTQRPGLAVHDAEALRVITDFYLAPLGLLVALVGLGWLAYRRFWAGLAYLSTFIVVATFFFYKMRIIPEHFWTARRFLPVILPAVFVLIGTAALPPADWLPAALRTGSARRVFRAIGVVVISLFGLHYLGQTMPVAAHVEYAGLIPHLERLDSRFAEGDLLVVESRRASDMHVLALPLAYIYARDTLVLARARPDADTFTQFLRWAEERYQRIFFLGGGGTELVSKNVRAIPVTGERFQIPEYEQAYRAYPREVRYKEFDFGLYELRPEPVRASRFELDVGTMDDLFVRRFHAKERHGASGTTFRWTRDISFVSLLGIEPDRRRLTLWASSPRPAQLDPPTVDLYLEDRHLGQIHPTPDFEAYRLEIPLELATALAESRDAAQLRLESNTWSPARVAGGGDTRELGSMIDRIIVDQ